MAEELETDARGRPRTRSEGLAYDQLRKKFRTNRIGWTSTTPGQRKLVIYTKHDVPAELHDVEIERRDPTPMPHATADTPVQSPQPKRQPTDEPARQGRATP